MDAPGYWGIAIRVGARVDLFNTGSGHVLLAFRSAEARGMMIAEQEGVEEDERRPDDLEERLAQIRLRGYEVMPSQQTAGVYNLSAPVLGGDGAALAALTCPYIAPLNRPKAPDIPGDHLDAAGDGLGPVAEAAGTDRRGAQDRGRLIVYLKVSFICD